MSAPAGAGKTTLLAAWFEGITTSRRAWVSLDQDDNSEARFAAAVVRALTDAGVVSPAVFGGHAPGLDRLAAALERATSYGRSATLVLDDVHELTEGGALACLEHLVEHRPALLDLVMATRGDPPLHLGRLRMDAMLSEIRNADLAFRVPEARDLFLVHGLQVTRRDVRAIVDLTEGWAAGLVLVAHALQGGADPATFLESPGEIETTLHAFLVDEVVLRQPEAVQRFLAQISVCDRVTPDLAACLSGDPNAGSVLERLERGGVFLERVDTRPTYRLGPLFAAVVRQLLRSRNPEMHRALHARAAKWHAEHHMPVEAEQHARRAEDWSLLGALMQGRWLEAAATGQEHPSGFDEPLPPEVVTATPELAVIAGASACARGDRDESDRYLLDRTDVPTTTAGAHETGLDRHEQSTLVLDVLRGRSFGPDVRSSAAVERLRRPDVDARLARFAALRSAEMHLDVGDFDGAKSVLAELVAEGRGTWTTSEATGLLALIHALEGRLGLADALATDVVQGNPWRQPTPASCARRLAIALRAAQRGHLAAAAEATRGAGPAPASRTLRAIEQALRGVLLADAGSPLTPLARHPAAGTALVALGYLEVVDPAGAIVPVGGPAERALGRARRGLAAGHHAAVVRDATTVLSHPNDSCHPRTATEALGLMAVATAARGERTAALDHLAAALARSGRDELWAPLIPHGSKIAGLLEVVVSTGGAHQAVAGTLLDELRSRQTGGALESLSEREAAVLRLLPTLMSNDEIAATMHVSVNTVKTRLKSIYRKLDVDSRRGAAMFASQLELLHDRRRP